MFGGNLYGKTDDQRAIPDLSLPFVPLSTKIWIVLCE